MTTWKKTACILCECNCGLEVQLGGEAGKHLMLMRGDEAHPGSRGYACEKAHRLNHYQHARDRLRNPLRRRADGTFEEIDWDTAIRQVAARLTSVRERFGAAPRGREAGEGRVGRIPSQLWDETSAVEPRFHRVDPTSYGVLLEETRNATVERAQPGMFGRFTKRSSHRSHLAAQIFFPVAFEQPFTTAQIFQGWLAGSVDTALRELNEKPGAPGSAVARETLRAALLDAAELRLPLFVDA